MPELPEVETIKNQLKEILPFTIKKVTKSSKIKSILKKEEFALKRLTIKEITRHGKLLIFHLSDYKFILSHLGMSGSWRISDNAIYEKHKHLELEGRNKFLTYVDPRRFGFLYIVGRKRKDEIIKIMGVDVSTKEFTHSYLYNVLKHHPKSRIKSLLLDQHFFAGIGNYMASEICAHAGVRPSRPCKRITKSETINLYKAVLKVVKQSIRSRGVTFQGGYKDANGKKGDGVKNLVVFHQHICQLCEKTKVKKVYINQRGTFYCPLCQK